MISDSISIFAKRNEIHTKTSIGSMPSSHQPSIPTPYPTLPLPPSHTYAIRIKPLTSSATPLTYILCTRDICCIVADRTIKYA